jgi:hypothetical protein
MILLCDPSKTNMKLKLNLKCFFALSVAAMQFACNSSRKDEQALKEIAETFRLSTQNYNWHARESLRQLDEKSSDYRLKELAVKWTVPAMVINKLSELATIQIDSLKPLLTEKNYGSILPQAANIYDTYADKVLNTNAEMKPVFKSVTEKANHFEAYASPAMAPLFLDKLILDISRLKADGIAFSNSKTALGCVLDMEKTSFLVGQNTQILAPGEMLEITAGLGAFTGAGNPAIKINNKNMPLEDGAMALAKIKAPLKPGKYKVPVEIAGIDREGKPFVNTVIVEYSVVEAP